MNEQIKKIVGNVSATVIANVIGTLVSLLTNLIAPKILGLETYGYWQLYVLYIGYVGIMELGWAEGLYLKLGGEKITDLQDKYIDVQIKSFSFFQIVLSIILSIGMLLFFDGNNLIYIVVCLMIFPANLKVFCNYILLATNEIKSYTHVTILDRGFFGIGLVVCFCLKCNSIVMIVLIDCLARILSAGYSLSKIRPALYRGRYFEAGVLADILDSLKCGSKLLVANLASTLVIGIVRIVISSKWDIIVFSQISFTISITNMVLVLINAIGIALFPILKTIREEQLVNTYKMLRISLSMLMIICMGFFFPARAILSVWLPEYIASLYYMGIIFPLIVYETRTAMLLNTYYKALRLEKELLNTNVYSLGISFVLSVLSVYVFDSIICAVASVLMVIVFRSVWLEVKLSSRIEISALKSNILEGLTCMMFIISATIVNVEVGFFLYLIMIIGYVLFYRKEVRAIFKMMNVIR